MEAHNFGVIMAGGVGSRFWPGVLFSTRWSWFDAHRHERDRGRASPGQSLGGGAPLAGGHSVFDRADRRQIASTARVGGPPARGTGTRT